MWNWRKIDHQFEVSSFFLSLRAAFFKIFNLMRIFEYYFHLLLFKLSLFVFWLKMKVNLCLICGNECQNSLSWAFESYEFWKSTYLKSKTTKKIVKFCLDRDFLISHSHRDVRENISIVFKKKYYAMLIPRIFFRSDHAWKRDSLLLIFQEVSKSSRRIVSCIMQFNKIECTRMNNVDIAQLHF